LDDQRNAWGDCRAIARLKIQQINEVQPLGATRNANLEVPVARFAPPINSEIDLPFRARR
jgi:hypothetical protein